MSHNGFPIDNLQRNFAHLHQQSWQSQSTQPGAAQATPPNTTFTHSPYSYPGCPSLTSAETPRYPQSVVQNTSVTHGYSFHQGPYPSTAHAANLQVPAPLNSLSQNNLHPTQQHQQRALTHPIVPSTTTTTSTQTANAASLSSSAIFSPLYPPSGEPTAQVPSPGALSNFRPQNTILPPQQPIDKSSSQIETLTAEQKELIQRTVDDIASTIAKQVRSIFIQYLKRKYAIEVKNLKYYVGLIPENFQESFEQKLEEAESTAANDLEAIKKIFSDLHQLIPTNTESVSRAPKEIAVRRKKVSQLKGAILYHHNILSKDIEKTENIKSDLAERLTAFCSSLIPIIQKAYPTAATAQTEELKKILDLLKDIFTTHQQEFIAISGDHTESHKGNFTHTNQATSIPYDLLITLIENLDQKLQENPHTEATTTLDNLKKILSNLSSFRDSHMTNPRLENKISDIPACIVINTLKKHAIKLLINSTYNTPTNPLPPWTEILSRLLNNSSHLTEIIKDIYHKTDKMGGRIKPLPDFKLAKKPAILGTLNLLIQDWWMYH